jgi:hypothetical protein
MNYLQVVQVFSRIPDGPVFSVIQQVSAMYEIQRLRLMEGATVGKYFAIVAVRNIREQLSPTRKGALQAKRYNTSSVPKGAA